VVSEVEVEGGTDLTRAVQKAQCVIIALKPSYRESCILTPQKLAVEMDRPAVFVTCESYGSFKCQRSGSSIRRLEEQRQYLRQSALSSRYCFWARTGQSPTQQNESCRLLGICDLNEKRAREVGSKYGIPWYSNLERFFNCLDWKR